MKVGVAGLGRMGGAIAARLLAQGHEVHVWNRTTAKTEALVQAGAHAAASPAALSLSSEIVLTVLTDAAALHAVYLGADGLLQANLAGMLFVDMSTVGVNDQREIAEEVRRRSGRYLECPVGGTVTPAREGKLIAFVGGEPADVERARPLLDQLCRRVEHVGDIGAGAAMKLAVNLPMHVYWAALREAIVLSEPLALDTKRLIDIFADTSGAPASLRARAPALADAIAGKAGRVDFDIDSIRKDLALMIDEARTSGAGLPVAKRALECFDEASKAGRGGEGAAALLTSRRDLCT